LAPRYRNVFSVNTGPELRREVCTGSLASPAVL